MFILNVKKYMLLLQVFSAPKPSPFGIRTKDIGFYIVIASIYCILYNLYDKSRWNLSMGAEIIQGKARPILPHTFLRVCSCR